MLNVKSWTLFILVLVLPVSTAVQAENIGETQDGAESPAGRYAQKLPGEGQVSPAVRFRVDLSPADAKQGESVRLTVHAMIADGWHIGPLDSGDLNQTGFPTELEVDIKNLEPIDKGFTASKEPKTVEAGVDTQQLYDGTLDWSREYRVISGDASYSVKGFVLFQACDDMRCLPPTKLEFSLGEIVASKPKPSGVESENHNEKTIGEPLVIELEDCNLTRVRPQLGNIFSLLVLGRGVDKMVLRGTVRIGPDATANLYLPEAKRYSLRNTGYGEGISGNNSTYVSVDQNCDEVLALSEAFAASRPIRIHDKMFRIQSIDKKGRTLTLQQVDMPLQGSVIGRKCPDFEFETVDGETVSNKTILGKVTVLDVWAVSCHNCYEGFPVIKKCQEKYSPENVRVVLFSTDRNRAFYDKQSPKLFKKYGGADWPAVLLPSAFESALVFGDYGFGSVVVDKEGVVRGIGLHGYEVKQVLANILESGN
ncbi:TlpA family protein disulfide reductase [Blastopirellula retiformator]|uniref:Thiol-disulfide oxidoreductase n=1 Tax=Blastopirellula retiformator TaxID=2527970 RepID=A0A5C5V1E8_9BACT|nr:TlpA disulfide reductase family protein [Blastopirellula retiformator]TWT31562.1 thiol-disulfide oxidoreductase [Blastopirellula retiformator]